MRFLLMLDALTVAVCAYQLIRTGEGKWLAIAVFITLVVYLRTQSSNPRR